MTEQLEAAPASDLMRIAAGTAGLGIIALGGTASVGAVLASAIGVWIAAVIGNARRRPLVRFTAWLVACATATVYIGVGSGLVLRGLPGGTIARARAAADSTAAAQPQPAWIEKLGGKAAPPFTTSGAVAAWAMVVGVVFALTLMGTMAGTFGWCAAMLMSLAVAGRWIPQRRAPPESAEA